VTQRGTELGLSDAVLDIGATPEPGLNVEDGLAVLAVVMGGNVGDDEGDRVGVGRGALQGEGELGGVDGAAPR